jgi:hypothetical protein
LPPSSAFRHTLKCLFMPLAGTWRGLSRRPVRIVRPPAFFVGPSCPSSGTEDGRFTSPYWNTRSG